MLRAIAPLVCVLAVAVPRVGMAQQQSERNPPGPVSGILQRITVDRSGGFHVTDTFAVVFGGIKQGSGMAAGPAVSREFADGSFLQLKAVYSIRQFKLLQARYDSRPLFHRRGMVSTRVRWQDAPELSLYPIGSSSPTLRGEYGERKTEWSGFVRGGLARNFTVTAGSGLERYAIDSGWIDQREDESLYVVPDAPGLGTRPWFVHSFVSAALDTRLSPDFSRTGGLLGASLHHYHGAHDGRASFRGLEAVVAQLIPTFRQSGAGVPWRGALDVSARAWLTQTGDGRSVPFFLMPTLGGGTYLRGYSSYRFRDRDALLLRAEYRWAVHPSVDVAALYEAGTVAPAVRGLRLGDMAQSAGGGLRVHSKSSGLLQADLALGRDGLKFSIGFGLGS